MDRIDVLWLMTPETPSVEQLLVELVNRPAWHRQANCRGADPALFFPERGEGRPVKALEYCAGCTVRSECLAVADSQTPGVWGGMTGRERKTARRGAA